MRRKTGQSVHCTANPCRPMQLATFGASEKKHDVALYKLIVNLYHFTKWQQKNQNAFQNTLLEMRRLPWLDLRMLYRPN